MQLTRQNKIWQAMQQIPTNIILIILTVLFIKRSITASVSVRPETSDLYLFSPFLPSIPAPPSSSSSSSVLQWHKSDPANSVRQSHARPSRPLITNSPEHCRFRDTDRQNDVHRQGEKWRILGCKKSHFNNMHESSSSCCNHNLQLLSLNTFPGTKSLILYYIWSVLIWFNI